MKNTNRFTSGRWKGVGECSAGEHEQWNLAESTAAQIKKNTHEQPLQLLTWAWDEKPASYTRV